MIQVPRCLRRNGQYPLLAPERGTRAQNPVCTELNWRGPYEKESLWLPQMVRSWKDCRPRCSMRSKTGEMAPATSSFDPVTSLQHLEDRQEVETEEAE